MIFPPFLGLLRTPRLGPPPASSRTTKTGPRELASRPKRSYLSSQILQGAQHRIRPPILERMTLAPPARGHTGTSGQDDQIAVNPMADYCRRAPRWELSELTVHPENTVSGGGDSSKAASSHPMECGNRCGKLRPLAILFDKTVSIDSSSRAVSMPSL